MMNQLDLKIFRFRKIAKFKFDLKWNGTWISGYWHKDKDGKYYRNEIERELEIPMGIKFIIDMEK